MSGVLRRTIFVDRSGGMVRFHDWARVDTGIGTMVELFSLRYNRPFDGTSATAAKNNPTDDISRIDAIEEIPMGKEKMILSDDSMALHGGALWPRTGY